MLEVEAAQAGLHRGLAVGRGPGCTQPAIGARPKTQCALALFLEHKLTIGETAFTTAPLRGFVLIDPGADRVHGANLAAVGVLDREEHLAPVGIKPVPRLARTGSAAAHPARRRRASHRRGGGVQSGSRMDELVWQPHLAARRFSPGRFANALAFDLVGVEKIADATAEAAQKQARRRCPMADE